MQSHANIPSPAKMPRSNSGERSESTSLLSNGLKRIRSIFHLKSSRKCRGIAECRAVIEELWNETFNDILELNGWPETVIEHLIFMPELHKLAMLTKNDFSAAQTAINIARMERAAGKSRLTGTVGQIAQDDVRLAIGHVELERERPAGRTNGLLSELRVKDTILAKKDHEIDELRQLVVKLDQENQDLRGQLYRIKNRESQESHIGIITISEVCEETGAAEAAKRSRGKSNVRNAV